MSENLEPESLRIPLEERLRAQVAADLEAFQAAYEDPKKGLQLLSKKTRIHIKTLRRLIQKAHSPSYQTLYKIYSHLTDTRNLNDTLAAAPPIVQEKLRLRDPQLTAHPGAQFSMEVEEELLNDRCFAELYVLAEVSPFDQVFVKNRFGDYGLSVLAKMTDLRVLRPQSDGKFTLGERRASFSAQAIKKVGLQLTQNYLKPERTDETYANHMGLYVTALSEKAYRQWIDIDVKAFRDKMAVLKEDGAKGSIPAFTFHVVDTLKGASHE